MTKQDYQELFDTKKINVDLKRRSLRGGAVTLISQAVTFLVQLVSTMVLARILTPQDYGMMAMVVSVTGLAGVLLNLGLSTAIIQRPEINHSQISTLFWINAGFGLFLTVAVASLSPLIAWFYKIPELTWMAASLAFNFFINGLAVQHLALLNRQMRFLTIAVIQVVALLIGICVAIVAGIYGYGYWALVFNSIINSICMVAGAWLASGWRPGLPKRDSGVGDMIRFGSDLVGINIITYLSKNLDNILIGRFHGSNVLGIYSKAYQLFMMPIANMHDPVNKVALPALSYLQNEPETYKNYYKKLLSIISFVTAPLVVFMFIYSEKIIIIVLGNQWIESSEIFKILSVAGYIMVVANTRGLVLISNGKSRRYLLLGLSVSVFTCLSFIVGLPWGAKGVAVSYTISNYLILYPSLRYAFKDTPVTVSDFFMAIYRPFFASLVMGIIGYISLIKINHMADIYILILCFMISILSYLFSIVVISGGTSDLREYYSYARIMLAKK